MASYPFSSLGIHFSEQLEARIPASVQEEIRCRTLSILKHNRFSDEKVVLNIDGLRIAIIVSPNGLVTTYKEIPRYHIPHRNRSSKKKKRRSNGKNGKSFQKKGKKH